MKRAALLLAVASIGGLGVLPGYAAQAANRPTTAPSMSATATKANTYAELSPTLAGANIRNMLGNLANDALVSKDMSKLTSHFDQTDQQRIAKSSSYSEGLGTKLDAQIDTFSRTWKQKYGHDFAVKNAPSTLNNAFVKLQEGVPTRDPQLVSAVIKATGEKASSTDPYSADSSIALANIQPSGKLPEMQVPLVSAKPGQWRIQVPNTLTAEKLRQNLTMQVSDLNQHSAQWPTKEADACQMVSHRILMAVMDKSSTGSSQASAAPAASKSQMTASASASAKPTAVSSATSHKWWQFWRW
jgi:hypothetical protein